MNFMFKLLQVLVGAECVRHRNEVAIKLGVIFSSFCLSRHLIKPPYGVVIGQQILHGLLTDINMRIPIK